MINIKNKTNCCGCTACMNICPKKAISMIEDKEGFLYPKVDKKKCINCGLCEKICPIINKQQENSLKKSLIIRTKNDIQLKNSTSGGFFTPLCNYVLSKNGLVYGVAFNEEKEVVHTCVSEPERAFIFQGSKYVQSNLNDVFSKIKKDLQNDIYVLFSGTPCQVEGLLKFLNKKYEKLITVDVICHGTPSPLLWRKYVEYMENKYNSKIKAINFRNKTYGYHCGTMFIEFENGKKYYGSARTDYMLKPFFSEISSRPSCYECKFKSLNHLSDFTIFDCWNPQKNNKVIKDDDKGFTNLIINTQNGLNLFDIISNNYEYYNSDFTKAINLDGIMVEHSAKKNKYREDFLKKLNEEGIDSAIKTYIPISRKDYLIEKSKKIFYKMGIIRIIKRMKGK